MRNAIGFYWTLPVPWAGFTALPEDIEAAARISRTIRYQCELIRQYARKHKYRLVAEKVFLEIEPDRGSEYIVDVLRPLEALCRAQGAALLHVDFSAVQGCRSHGPLSGWAQHADIDIETVYPDEILIEGEVFDPHRHFSDWRQKQHEWTMSKPDRIAKARHEADQLRAAGRTHRSIATELNERDVRSASGKPWTEDRIRQLLRNASK
ncbi:recombinase family protein [Gemmobacter nectariphilus]|uniref:recombinase family protein n=1 Tax=Gemmobacter nectariphilus TaxID=220343 RepID=UPI000489A324|nr:recombinase family protein [Gemmobacter nectariphilus]